MKTAGLSCRAEVDLANAEAESDEESDKESEIAQALLEVSLTILFLL
jgi:hypothetical protein